MSYNETEKLALLNSLKEEAFSDKVDTQKAEQISLELKTIPDSEKSKFLDFVSEFLELGFSKGYESDINLFDFLIQNEAEEITEVLEELNEDKKAVSRAIVSFKDLFDKVKIELQDYFINYKGYFITELINSRTEFGYKIVFFYESTYHIAPLKGRVRNQLGDYDCIFREFKSSDDLELEMDSNYLCIFLLMSKMNDKDALDTLKNKIHKFISGFEDFYYYSISKENCENTNRKDDFIDEIDIVLSTYMSNREINFEEEKIIKKLCADFKSPLLFYKILSGGFSGSKVLEIRPKKTNNFENDKIYIVKYGYISAGKIKKEKDNFSAFIKGRKGFSSYTDANYVKTLHYEGILYNYAISDNSKSSVPFNDIVKSTKEPYKDIEKKRNVITKLFSQNEAFDKWREDYNEIKEAKVKDLYIDYVSKDKIKKSIKKVLNDESKSKEMLDIFDKISNYQLKYKETVCHGDLHTDNFFIDDEGNVYLIDFGFTNKRHAILDYTSLESSLKFKHFPFYLEREEIEVIEEELLSHNTFDYSYSFTSTTREEIIDLLLMINSIRNNAIRDLIEDNKMEYYISLYLLSIRQIRYPNMNQLYACHSAKILGNYIIKNLGL